jgi:hypothetical protein
MAVDRADGAALAERAAVVAWLRFREGRHMVASEEAARAQSYAQALEHGSFRGAFRSAADAIERGDHATGSADDRP